MAGNAILVNFAGGETSPKSRGRFDQPWYVTAARKLVNFIAETSGPARFRPGFEYVRQTRHGAVARLVPFQVNNNLSYMLEFTPLFMRAYFNGDLITTTITTVTGLTRANPAVITVASAAGLSNGDEIIITDMVGVLEGNNRQFRLGSKSGSTFHLLDPVTGADIDSSSWAAAWSSGGTVKKVYEVATPYSALELQSIQWAQNNTTMYIVCPTQVPYKLTVDAYGGFTLNTYTRTNDPFSAATSAVTINDVRPLYVGDTRTKAAPAVTITPAAVTGAGINFTASASLFASTDVGKYIELVGAAGSVRYGRAKITAFTSDTVVVCTILTDFNSTVAIPAGSWRIMTVETQVTLASSSVINPSGTYTISGVGGATTINGNTYYLVAYEDALITTNPRFIIRATADNAPIDSSGWGVYTSGGTGTPTSATSQPALTITGITRGTRTIITFAAGSAVNENSGYIFSGVVGTVEINGGTYFLNVDAGVVYLVTAAGVDVDSSAWTAYTSGGIATLGAECPLAVAFYEGRLVFAGTNQRPDCLFLSRAPDNSGNSRYDDFTGGSNADHACFFQLAPVSGSVDYISWARGGPDYLFIGTFGGPFRVSGSGLDIPITPSSINVRQFDTAGAEETMPAGLAQMFFIQRGGTALRSIKVINPYLATFESLDLCLNSEQIMSSPLSRVVLAQGRPNVLWVVREDGVLAGLSVHVTVEKAEQVAGWHRHIMGGADIKVLDLAVTQRTSSLDLLWITTERTVAGVTRRFVETAADDVIFPDFEDFFTDDKDFDTLAFNSALYRLQEGYVHSDAAATYDGSARGVTAAATLTPGTGYATVGNSVTFTASASVFTAADVGAEIWKKPHPLTGRGGGRAVITAYTSGTQVTATILAAFDSNTAVAAGGWYFAVTVIYGLSHLDGSVVSVVTDGAVYSDGGQTDDDSYPAVTVALGKITLTAAAAVVHVGLPYVGYLETHNLEMGGQTGPAQAKPRSISELDIRFLNTLGVEYGTDLYNMSKVEHRLSNAVADRPAPVFSGIRRLNVEDFSSGLDDATREKKVVVAQRLPLPAIVQFVDVRYDTADAG